MSSVTVRAKEVKQPRGGYIKPSQFEEIILSDNNTLGEENIHASVIGTVVDCLTRVMTGTSVKEAFRISMWGYDLRTKALGDEVLIEDQESHLDIETLLKRIKGLDDDSIISACKAVTYDVWYRNIMGAMMDGVLGKIRSDSRRWI